MSNPNRHLRSVNREEQDNDRETVPLENYYAELKRLSDAKQAIANDISDLLRAAKGDGWDTGILKQVLKIASMVPETRDTQFQLLFGYLEKAASIHVDLGFHGK